MVSHSQSSEQADSAISSPRGNTFVLLPRSCACAMFAKRSRARAEADIFRDARQVYRWGCLPAGAGARARSVFAVAGEQGHPTATNPTAIYYNPASA